MALRADSSLGLFVVARLASRLGIAVTFDPSRYGGTRATVLIPTQHLAGEQPAGAPNGAEFQAGPLREDLAVPAPVGGVARQVQESAPGSMDTPSSFSGQIPMRRDVKPRPHPARSLTPPSPAPRPTGPEATEAAEPPIHVPQRVVEDKPRLPRRDPQQNLVAQLQEEPEEDTMDATSVAGDGTARTLTAFAKGTRRGRDGAGES
jgi:hypothetical protein